MGEEHSHWQPELQEAFPKTLGSTQVKGAPASLKSPEAAVLCGPEMRVDDDVAVGIMESGNMEDKEATTDKGESTLLQQARERLFTGDKDL